MRSFLVYWSEGVVQRTDIVNAILNELRDNDLGTMMGIDFSVHVLRTEKPQEASAVIAKHVPKGLTWFIATAKIEAGSGDGSLATGSRLLSE